MVILMEKCFLEWQKILIDTEDVSTIRSDGRIKDGVGSENIF